MRDNALKDAEMFFNVNPAAYGSNGNTNTHLTDQPAGGTHQAFWEYTDDSAVVDTGRQTPNPRFTHRRQRR